MPFAKTKFWLLLLATLTALLFLGNLATNLLSSDIQDSLRAFWGQNYQRNLLIICLALATIAAFVYLKSTENPQSISHISDSNKQPLPTQRQEINIEKLDKANTIIQGDVHIENGNFIGRDQVINNYYKKEPSINKSEYRTIPTPADIVSAISKSLPYEKEIKAKNYVGLKVEWTIYLNSISQKSSKEVMASFLYNEKPFCIIFADVSIEEYPILKLLEEGHPITIKGQITHVGEYSVRLSVEELDIIE